MNPGFVLPEGGKDIFSTWLKSSRTNSSLLSKVVRPTCSYLKRMKKMNNRGWKWYCGERDRKRSRMDG